MKPARIAVIAIAVLSGAGAFFLAGRRPPPVQIVTPAALAPVLPTEEVLVASKDVPMGSTILKNVDFKWQVWPKAAVSPQMIVRSANQNAEGDIDGSIAAHRLSFWRAGAQGQAHQGNRRLPLGDPALRHARHGDQHRHQWRQCGGRLHPADDRVDILRTYRDEAGAASTGRNDALRRRPC